MFFHVIINKWLHIRYRFNFVYLGLATNFQFVVYEENIRNSYYVKLIMLSKMWVKSVDARFW